MKTPTRSKEFQFTLTSDSPAVIALAEGSHGDPFSLLGRHPAGKREVFRCFLPRTKKAWIEDESRPMHRVPGTDLFEYLSEPGELPPQYLVIRESENDIKASSFDPYSFWPQLQHQEMEAFQMFPVYFI